MFVLVLLLLLGAVLCRRRKESRGVHWTECPLEHGTPERREVRIFDITTDKESYALGDDMETAVHGRVTKGCLVHPVLVVDVRQNGVTFRTVEVPLCSLPGAECPVCEGDDFAFTIAQDIPNLHYLHRFLNEPFEVRSHIEDAEERLSCVAFPLVLTAD